MNKRKFIAPVAALVLLVGTVFALSFVSSGSSVVSASDCSNDTNAVKACGVSDINALRSSYNTNAKGMKALFAHYGITEQTISSGKYAYGKVTRDGDVIVNGKVIATGATSAGRHNMPGSTKINAGGYTFYDRPTQTSFRSAVLDAIVFTDSNGKFIAAVIKECANPVKAQPKPVPVAVCKDLKVNKISRTEFAFTGEADVKDGATVSEYVFTVKDAAGKTVKTVTKKSTATSATSEKVALATPGNYSVSLVVKTSVGDKDGSQCVKMFSVEKPALRPYAECKQLAEPRKISRTSFVFTGSAATKDGATISQYVFTIKNAEGNVVKTVAVNSSATLAKTEAVEIADPGKYTVELTVKTSVGEKTDENCVRSFTVEKAPAKPVEEVPTPEVPMIEVCVIEDKSITSITKEEFDANPDKYTTDMSKCEEVPQVKGEVAPEAPKEIASTGPEAIVGGLIGSGALGIGATNYIRSRRALKDAFRA